MTALVRGVAAAAIGGAIGGIAGAMLATSTGVTVEAVTAIATAAAVVLAAAALYAQHIYRREGLLVVTMGTGISDSRLALTTELVLYNSGTVDILFNGFTLMLRFTEGGGRSLTSQGLHPPDDPLPVVPHPGELRVVTITRAAERELFAELVELRRAKRIASAPKPSVRLGGGTDVVLNFAWTSTLTGYFQAREFEGQLAVVFSAGGFHQIAQGGTNALLLTNRHDWLGVFGPQR